MRRCSACTLRDALQCFPSSATESRELATVASCIVEGSTNVRPRCSPSSASRNIASSHRAQRTSQNSPMLPATPGSPCSRLMPGLVSCVSLWLFTFVCTALQSSLSSRSVLSPELQLRRPFLLRLRACVAYDERTCCVFATAGRGCACLTDVMTPSSPVRFLCSFPRLRSRASKWGLFWRPVFQKAAAGI